mmetsp:Transcript_108479/g.302514  ORF Transcript_108479/g.302514 Transcript_108479/m.302514 type:complete len:213 (-) Transcript_108479:2-640(-)
MMTLTSSMALRKRPNMSSGSICSSRMQRSTLLTKRQGFTRSARDCRSTVSVCTAQPSMQSTTTMAPSVMRRAAVTSEEKSTCPGESIRLIKCGWGPFPSSSSSSKYRDTPVLLIVTPLSCSSARVSVKRASPACLAEMIPALQMSESVSVDFPWSTCAMTLMDRMLSVLSMIVRICSTVKFGMAEGSLPKLGKQCAVKTCNSGTQNCAVLNT